MATTDNLGLGVMIRLLTSNASQVEAWRNSVNKTIASVRLEDDALRFVFTDGTRMKMYDAGQSCCETRYMSTDDDLSQFTGAVLLDAEVRDAPDINEGGNDEPNEVQFLVIVTDRGNFTMANHNKHNGYYGGFSIEVCDGDD